MKRSALLKLLSDKQCVLYRQGNKHDIYVNVAGKKTAIPRHNEIKDSLVRMILKQLDI